MTSEKDSPMDRTVDREQMERQGALRPKRIAEGGSDPTSSVVTRLAEREQVTVSDYLRGLVKHEAAKHFGWTPDTPAKRGAKR